MRLYGKKFSGKGEHARRQRMRFGQFESLESRQMLNAAPVANDDNYPVAYETPLSVARLPVNPSTFRGLTEATAVVANYQVSQVELAQHAGLLFVREGFSRIRIVDAISGLEIEQHSAKGSFTDIDLTPDGRYLYAADFGGQLLGTVLEPHWVHRYDTVTRQWEVKQAPGTADRIEAVDKDRFLLTEWNQSVDLTLNHFGAAVSDPVAELDRERVSTSLADIEYDHRTVSAYVGSLGAWTIAIVKVDENSLTLQSETSTTAGGAISLSADGKHLFYGPLQVSPANVGQSQFVHPHLILAGTAGMAFSQNNVYSAETGEAIGTIGYPATLISASDDGIHLIAYDGAGSRQLRVYQVRPLGWGVLENDTDAQRDPLTASLVTGPAHGTLKLNPDGTFQYTPNDGYYGSDSFTYRAHDGFGDSNIGKVNLTVASLAPLAKRDSFGMGEETTIEVPAESGVLANDSDPESQKLTALLVEGPRIGKLTLNEDGSFRYVPRADFSGIDWFTYQASDGLSKSAATIVTLEVFGNPDPPVGVADSYTVTEDGKLSAQVLLLDNDVDPDGDKLFARLLSLPTHGTLHSGGTLQFKEDGWFGYLPDADFSGTDQFTYSVTDGSSHSAPVTVTLTITPVEDAPVAKVDSYGTDEDSPFKVSASAGVLANDSDVDGDSLTAKLITQPSQGTVTLAPDGSFVYTPRANFNGTDTFRYATTDSQSASEATVTIVVRPVADAPQVTTDTYTVLEDQVLNVTLASGVLANDSDLDGGKLTAHLVGPSPAGLLFQSDGTFVYTPPPNFSGHATFAYRASNGNLVSNLTQVGITVTGVNDVPVAGDDRYLVGGSLNVGPDEGVLANDQDFDNTKLMASVVAGPQHGQLTLNPNGSFTYIPGASFELSDSFTYRASDGIVPSNVATVRIDAALGVTTTNVTLTSSEDGPVEGFFDVIVRVAPGAGLSTAGYEVSLGVPDDAGIELLGATLAPESPLFVGQTPVFSIVDNQLLVTDVSPNGPLALQNGARLFRVEFAATPEAVGTIPVLFDREFTNLSDGKGAALPLAPPRGGSITVIDGITPKVEQVMVAGTEWTASFLAYLDAQGLGGAGYSVSSTAAQAPILPWTNLNQISIRFSEDVQVDREDLRVFGITVPPRAFSGMTYDTSTFTATWTLAAPMSADRLTATLSGSGEGAVRDRAGNLLDGNTAADVAGDYKLRFDVLPGDVDRDGVTNVLDTVKTRKLQFTRAGDARYSAVHDVDGSGSIGIFDTIQVRNNQFSGLPQEQPNGDGGNVAPAPPAVRIRTENVTITSQPGAPVEGVFNVFVEVLPGADVSVAGYDVALSTPAGSGVTLLSDGLASAEYPALFASEPFEFKFLQMLGVTDTLAAGATALPQNAGLFSVRFAVAPGTVGEVPLLFTRSFTNLADANGNAVPVELDADVISITQPLTTITGTSGDDQYHVVRSGSQLLIYENPGAPGPVGEPKYKSEIGALGPSLTINALGGDDSLTVDSGDQAALGLGQLIFNAGAGNNTIVLARGSARIDGTATAGTLNTSVGEGAHLSTGLLRQNGLSIGEDGRVTLLPNGGTSVITDLTLGTGATFDIGNGALVLDYSGASPVEMIREKILSGRTRPGLGEGTWTGTGITSSAAAAANQIDSEMRSVGYAENALLPLGAYSTFRGVPVDNTAILVVFTRTGDANLDGLVGDDDVTILGASNAPHKPNGAWAFGDFDYDGFVEDDDVTAVGAFYDSSAAPVAAPLTLAPPSPLNEAELRLVNGSSEDLIALVARSIAGDSERGDGLANSYRRADKRSMAIDKYWANWV